MKRRSALIAMTLAAITIPVVPAQAGTINNTSSTEDTGVSAGVMRDISVLVTNNIFAANSLAVSTEAETETEETCTMYTTTRVNIRTSANKESTDNIIDTLDPNTKLKCVVGEDKWTKVYIDDATVGYIYSKYLSDNKVSIKDMNRWGIKLTSDEKNMLADILYLEANNQCYEGKVGVVEVIFNRMKSEKFPDTLYGVLSAKGQFTSWKIRSKAKPGADLYEIIDDVLEGRTSVLSTDYMYFSRAPQNNRKIKIEDHYFCKG